MASAFEIKQHDRRPFFVVNLTDESGTVNLTTAGSAVFNMGTATNGVLGAAVISRGSATITNAATGEVTYQWGTADTANPGNFLSEVEVIWNDGKPETFPGGPTGGNYWDVTITKDIA